MSKWLFVFSPWIAGCFCLASSLRGQEVLFEQSIKPQPIQVILQATVEAVRLPFVFDTGADLHGFDQSVGAYLKNPAGSGAVDSFGDLAEMKIFESPNLTLSGWKYPRWYAFGTDFSGLRRVLGVEIKGALGPGPLRDVSVEFNFDKKYVRFIWSFKANEEAKIYTEDDGPYGSFYVPLGKFEKRKQSVAKVKLAGEVIDLTIDTGSNGGIGLEHLIFEKLVADGVITLENSAPPSRTETVRKTTIGAVSGRFTKGKLFGLDLKGFPVSDKGSISTVGMEFLVNFNFVLDYPNALFHFERRRAESPIRPYLMLGASVLFIEGRCQIGTVFPADGPAATAGLKSGDEILKLGSLDKSDLSFSAIYDLCLNSENSTVNVQVARLGTNAPINAKLIIGEKQFRYPLQ